MKNNLSVTKFIFFGLFLAFLNKSMHKLFLICESKYKIINLIDLKKDVKLQVNAIVHFVHQTQHLIVQRP